MVLSRPRLTCAALAALLAVANSPAAHGMIDESGRTIIHDDPSLKPICIACLGDNDFFIVERAAECKSCTSARAQARCRHQRASLVNLHYLADQGRWSRSQISHALPPTSAWLGPGGGNTLLLAGGEELSRLHLVREGSSWKLVRSETVIPWSWLAAMSDGATVYPTMAVTPDRSVVVGLDRTVLLLPPDLLKSGPGGARWLLGKPPAPAEPRTGPGAAPDPGAGMLVAVDPAGRVLVLDRKTRGLLAIDPATGAISRVLRGEQWPLKTFVPVDLVAAGRHLFVYGHASASPLAGAVLVGLDPGGKGDPCVISPAIETVKGAPFTFTPAGHMALADCFKGRIWFFPNPAARPAVKGESSEQAAARAAADAAYSALLEEVAAEAATAKPSGKVSRVETIGESKAEPVDPEAEPERPAGPALGARAGSADLESPARPSGTGGIPAQRPAGAGLAGIGGPAAKPQGGKPDETVFRRYPSGQVNQRNIAQMAATLADRLHFGRVFDDWAARQRSRQPVREVGLAERVAAADRSVPLAVPATPPAGLARFTLGEAALRRVVKWMLLNAGRANRPDEVAAWRARGGRGNPLFSFGMYENNRCPQVILELADLRPVADSVDALGGDAGTSVAGQMDAADGIVGVRAPKDGPARFGYGLTLVLGEGNRSIAAIHAGGTWAVEHRWSGSAGGTGASAPEAPASEAPASGAPASEAPASEAPAAAAAPVPAARPKFRLNPLAPPFVMPGT